MTRRKTILIVDDDQDIRFIIAKSLESLGYRIRAASNGSEALRVAKVDKFDMAIVDIRLPDMGGRQVIKGIRKIRARMPVVVVTGSSGEPDLETRAEVEGWIRKPFRLDELRSTVRGILEG